MKAKQQQTNASNEKIGKKKHELHIKSKQIACKEKKGKVGNEETFKKKEAARKREATDKAKKTERGDEEKNE